MNSVVRGMVAGFLATVILSVLLLLKDLLGLLPQFQWVGMLQGLLGTQDAPAVGWMVHFAIGTLLWGGLFAWLAPRIKGAYWLKGAGLATAAWLAMMLVLMPVAGAGLFAQELGATVAIATLVLHWIFGAALGAIDKGLEAAAHGQSVREFDRGHPDRGHHA